MPSSPEPAAGSRPRARRCSARFSKAGGACFARPRSRPRVLGATFLLRAAAGGRSSGDRSKSTWARASKRTRAAAGWNAGWAAEFAAQAQGLGAHVHARDPRLRRHARHRQQTCSTTSRSIRRSPARSPSTSRCGSSCPAASSTGSRAAGRSATGGVLLPRAASTSSASCGSPSSSARRTGRCFRWLHPFLFGTLYDRLDARHDRGARRHRAARRAVPGLPRWRWRS